MSDCLVSFSTGPQAEFCLVHSSPSTTWSTCSSTTPSMAATRAPLRHRRESSTSTANRLPSLQRKTPPRSSGLMPGPSTSLSRPVSSPPSRSAYHSRLPRNRRTTRLPTSPEPQPTSRAVRRRSSSPLPPQTRPCTSAASTSTLTTPKIKSYVLHALTFPLIFSVVPALPPPFSSSDFQRVLHDQLCRDARQGHP